jgi:hypothetical protein
MSIDLKRLDQEDKKYLEEYDLSESFDLEKILGFKLPKGRCFVAPAPCSRNVSSPLALVPLYDVIFYPIYSAYFENVENNNSKQIKINNDSIFEKIHGFKPSELRRLAEDGRIVPYFTDESYEGYDAETIKPLLMAGVPTVSPVQRTLIVTNHIKTFENQTKWKQMEELSLIDAKLFSLDDSCANCLTACYYMGFRDYFIEKKNTDGLCFLCDSLVVHPLNAVMQTECRINRELLSRFGGLPEQVPIEYILEGLKINYSTEIPLEEYLDVFDTKTTKAIRRIVNELLNDPLSRNYSQILKNKVFDFNQQVNEIGKGKAAKVFESISDMAIYGGEKFIESQTNKMIKIPKRGLITIGEWLASKGIDFQTKITHKDWAIAQLYKAKCKLDKKC